MKKIISTIIIAALTVNSVYASVSSSSGAVSFSSYGGTIREAGEYGANLVYKGKKNKLIFNAYMECREYVAKCRITAVLQVYENGKYVTDVTSASTEYSSSSTWNRAYYVESGKHYRARVKFQSYNKDDKLIETKYITTRSIEAP